MKKIIHFNPEDAGKLHCDKCGHVLPDRQPFIADLVGTPCPICGADMLSQKDFDDTRRIVGIINWINKWFGWLGQEKLDQSDPSNLRKVSIKTHNGSLLIKTDRLNDA